MHKARTGSHHDARGQAVAGQVDGPGQDATDVEHDRADPQGLLADGVEVFVAGRVAGRRSIGGGNGFRQRGGVAG